MSPKGINEVVKQPVFHVWPLRGIEDKSFDKEKAITGETALEMIPTLTTHLAEDKS